MGGAIAHWPSSPQPPARRRTASRLWPGFADPANGNLSLTPGSPAVDGAFSGTLTAAVGSVAPPATIAWGGGRVDDAATANAGDGTISYADGGAYEMHNPGFSRLDRAKDDPPYAP